MNNLSHLSDICAHFVFAFKLSLYICSLIKQFQVEYIYYMIYFLRFLEVNVLRINNKQIN